MENPIEKQHFTPKPNELETDANLTQFWNFVNSNNFKDGMQMFLKHYAGNRREFLLAYVLDIVLVLIIIAAVSILAYTKVIDGVSTGTLIGAVIGYALGRFRNP